MSMPVTASRSRSRVALGSMGPSWFAASTKWLTAAAMNAPDPQEGSRTLWFSGSGTVSRTMALASQPGV